jgi:hypothetical protein
MVVKAITQKLFLLTQKSNPKQNIMVILNLQIN